MYISLKTNISDSCKKYSPLFGKINGEFSLFLEIVLLMAYPCCAAGLRPAGMMASQLFMSGVSGAKTLDILQN